MGEFVLFAPIASSRGTMRCYVRDTAIGPASGSDPDHWQRFESEESARKCPAMWHPLSVYEPRPLENVLREVDRG